MPHWFASGLYYIHTKGTPMTDSQQTMLEMISPMHIGQQIKLEIMTARERLMEDIDSIVDSFDRDSESNDDLVSRLCDAVCTNFPVK